MVLPLILGGLAIAAAGVAGGYILNDEIEGTKKSITNNYQNIYQTSNKYDEIIIGDKSKIGKLSISDNTSMAATEKRTTEDDKTLLYGALGVGGLLLVKELKGGKK